MAVTITRQNLTAGALVDCESRVGVGLDPGKKITVKSPEALELTGKSCAIGRIVTMRLA
jgi:hypothetical protein